MGAGRSPAGAGAAQVSISRAQGPGPGSAAGSTTRRSLWLARLDSPLAPYYLILGSVVALVTIGLVMVLSSSNVEAFKETDNPYAVFSKQLTFACIGLPLAWIASRIPIPAWKRLAWPALAVGAAGLVAVALIGEEVGGNRNWLHVGPVTLQPSEAAKLALIIWGAAVLSRKHTLLGQVPHVLIPVVPAALLLLLLVMLGGDLGTALVLVAITVALLFAAGAPLRVFLVGGILGGAVIAQLVAGSENRMRRLGIWAGEGACNFQSVTAAGAGDYYATCWQPIHSRWALATGGWWGVGLGNGREKWLWLPAAHNDYIFAVIGEELGLMGTLTVLALFAALGVGLFKLVLASDDTFVKIATGGVLAWVLGQAIINIGTVLGMVPVIGLPLPLVSSGGSALVMVLVTFGMVLGFARQVPGAPAALRARARIAGRTASVLSRRRLGGRRGAGR